MTRKEIDFSQVLDGSRLKDSVRAEIAAANERNVQASRCHIGLIKFNAPFPYQLCYVPE